MNVSAAPARAMNVSEQGLDFIKRWEGLEQTAYSDIAGVATIGYGHTASVTAADVVGRRTITEAEAARLLAADVGPRAREVARLIDVPLAQHEFDALVSFHFNTGGLGRSTVRLRLNAGDRKGAADALLWWNKARVGGRLQIVRGLARRRAAERAMFLGRAG